MTRPVDRAHLLATTCLVIDSLATVSYAANSERATASLQEVVVTARRREERSIDVPISMTVQSGAQLEERNAFALPQILPHVPNTNIELPNARLTSIAIRGLGRNLGNDGLESSTGVFLDGVYLGRLGMAVSDFGDLKQVEVLRGPQGTLFGKNTTAGVVNIVTNEPRFESESRFDITAGNNELLQLRGMVGGSLIDEKLAFRLSAFDSQRDGFVSSPLAPNGLGELNRSGVRGQLLWVGEALRVRVIADYGKTDEDGPGFAVADPLTYYENGAVRPNNFLARSARAGYTPILDPLERRNDSDDGLAFETTQSGISVQGDWRVGTHDFTSITAWRRFYFLPEADGDYTALDIQRRLGFEIDDEQITQELRMASPTGGHIDYVTGIFLFAQRLTSTFRSIYGSDAADWFQAGLPAYVLDGFAVTTIGDPATDSGAVFGQATWHVNERFDATLGVRWTADRKTAKLERSAQGGVPVASTDTAALAARAQLGAPVVTDVKSSEDFVSGLVSVSYRFRESAHAYASLSHGAKSGGINVAIAPPGIDQVVKPEVATSSELGFKMSHTLGQHGGQIDVSVAAFNIDVKDYQAALRDPVRGAVYLGSAESLRSWGFELETAYVPSADTSISLTFGWNDARFESFPNSTCPAEKLPQPTCDLSGERLPGAQPWKVGVRTDHSRPLQGSLEGWNAFVGFDFSAVGSYQGDLSRHTEIDDYQVLDARIGIRSRSGAHEVLLWARNALNEDYFVTKTPAGSFNTGVVFGILADPRTYGLSIRVSF